jgi:tetratricopeptide (TPR) repeat protein
MAVMGNFENIRYYNMRGQAKYKLQDYDGAIADFTRVIKSLSTRRDQKGKAYFWRGMVRIETGQKENGCLDLRKSLKLGNEKAADLLDIYCFQNMF